MATLEGKEYCLIEGYRLPPVMLTEQEANAIVTVQYLILHNKDTSLIATYSETVQEIKVALTTNTAIKQPSK